MEKATGNIRHFTDEEIKVLESDLRSEMAPLTEEQHKILRPMSRSDRKGYMRNQPCPCGSGKKFKKCCW